MTYSRLFCRIIFYSIRFLFRIIIIQDRFNLNVSVRLFNELFFFVKENEDNFNCCNDVPLDAT